MTPFISFYTPTFKRPQKLAACLQSVAAQTAVADIEQIVIPDHVGLGVGGMFAQVPRYRDAVHGRYVHMLCDDDVLASPTVVAEVKAFAEAHGDPPVILVKAVKAGMWWPAGDPWPPRCGAIDLGCIITRADVWKQHDYGHRYEGDYDLMQSIADAGHQAAWCGVLFSIGGVNRGAPEVAA